MAWYALYKWFAPFRKTPYTDWNVWYSNKLYNDWFQSLTSDEQEKIKTIRERRKVERKKRAEQSLAMLDVIMSCLDRMLL